ESAYRAAYFAASEAARLIKEEIKNIGKQIAVWAVRVDIEKISTVFEKIYIVRALWESNPNLRAQRGLFTLYVNHNLINQKQIGNLVLEDSFSLNKVIEKFIESNKRNRYELSSPVMYCLRLDINESGFLLHLLHQEGISAASIFPGYTGVVHSLKELRCHRRPNWYINKLMKDITQNHKDIQQDQAK
ncbi:MAG: hypothetical protein ACFFDN_17110, partial [Candidatus Hodarchaeota archaeon]